MNKALTFMLGNKAFGMAIEPVREIIGLARLTPVPLMPRCLRGVMNLRGQVVPVVDLANRLGLGVATETERSCVLMLEGPMGEGSQQVLGLLVDAVNDVLCFAPEQLAAPPQFGTRIRTEFIAGMLPQGTDAMALLAVDRLLALDDLEDAADCAVAAPA